MITHSVIKAANVSRDGSVTSVNSNYATATVTYSNALVTRSKFHLEFEEFRSLSTASLWCKMWTFCPYHTGLLLYRLWVPGLIYYTGKGIPWLSLALVSCDSLDYFGKERLRCISHCHWGMFPLLNQQLYIAALLYILISLICQSIIVNTEYVEVKGDLEAAFHANHCCL